MHRVQGCLCSLRTRVDDQEHPVVGLQPVAVVGHGLGSRRRRPIRDGLGRSSGTVGRSLQRRLHRALGQRQVQRETASVADRRLHVDLAAQQPRDLPGDGQAQTGPSVLARDRTLGLLEGLEDRPELLVRDPHPRVGDRERDHVLGAPEPVVADNGGGVVTPAPVA